MSAMASISIFHDDFDGFVEFLREQKHGPDVLSPKRFSEVLNIDLQTLAIQAHVHQNTLRHAPASENVQRFLLEMSHVICAAVNLSGDVEKALFWYRNAPLRLFEYKLPEQIVSEGRSNDLIRYLESLEAGALG